MRVCFVVGTLGRGGAERQLLYLLRALSAEGQDSRVLCLTSGEAFEADVREMGIEIEYVGESPNRLQRLRKIITEVGKYEPDIIQSSHFYTNIYAAVAGKIARVPSIGAIRNDLRSEIGSDTVFGRWQVALPTHLVANSKVALERAVERGISPTKIDLVENVVNLPGTEPSGVDKPKEDISISFVGRLAAQKRPEVFIELANRMNAKLPAMDLKFRIVGDGPLRGKLEAHCADLGLSEEKVRFEGERPNISEVYSSSDILVLPSSHEGTPNVLLEAMAFGVPVVATSVGGVPELLSDGNGVLVDADDFEQLAAATEELIVDPGLRMRIGIAGRDHVRKHHSAEDLAGKMTAIYERLLNGTSNK
ncbi:MAG: glycosyltransferase [Acidobacteriota bacterium]|nr:MAG: glycosyltransferase [Acidobacteriota bacterium]